MTGFASVRLSAAASTRRAGLHIFLLFVIAWLMLAGGCARLPDTRVTMLKPRTLSELQGYLLNHKADLDQFRLRGPFAVAEQKNRELQLSPTERFKADLFLSSPAEKAPLVIFLHGLDSSKEAHAYQAMHVASWGMHCMTLQLPNSGPWVGNGKILARIVNLIYLKPEIIDRRIDVSKIILVGHSFGGSAVAIALAEGAPAIGGILLDAAAIGKNLPGFLKKINQPVMLLGADEEIILTRHRDYFYRYLRDVAEISIKDANHEDAQYPSEFSLQNAGFDPYTTEDLQVTFASAITAAAFSLSSTRTFDYAWRSFGSDIESGKLFNAKRK